jgi:hypothetical protein
LFKVRDRILAALAECTIAELAAEPMTPVSPRAAVLHTHI